MDLTYAELSSPGPARENNEDFVGFWQPETVEEKRQRGAIAILCDGVGGQNHGEVASRLAVETGLKTFREAKAGDAATDLIITTVNAANVAVYDKGQTFHDAGGRMATTMAVAVFRNNQVAVGNVGDSRVYLVRKTEVKQLTTDHSYVGMQRKFGLISEHEAKTSDQRSLLTRSVGQEPVARVDADETQVFKGDRIVLCSDGLHAHVADNEIGDIVARNSPAQACRQLVALAEQRGTDDNLSIQVIQIDEIEAVSFYRGVPAYHTPADVMGSRDVQPGQTLDDRFYITEIISRSGMATIFKATDKQTNQTVAVKVPFLQFESDPGVYSRFEREEAIGLKLDHPYLLKFIPIEKRSRPYIVTEYLRGYTLAHLLNNVRPLPESDALKFASRICDALAHMHERGVVHRDLKPQNIMVCSDGTLRIMDFGIAKAAEGRRITFTGFTPAVGTPDYMAPEQVKGKRGDERTDIYSLGAILYEMATGVLPFVGENPFVIMNARVTGDPVAPRKQNPKISPQIEEIILHAMSREPNDRHPNVAALKAELDKPADVQIAGRANRLQAITPWQSSWQKHRSLVWKILIPAIVIGLFVLLVMKTGRSHR